MTDWSEIFEKRLQTVLQNDGKLEKKTAAALDQTPPHRDLRHELHQPTDPTSAFFELLKRRAGGGGGSSGGPCRHSDSSGPVMTPPAQQIKAPDADTDTDTEASITRLQTSYAVRARDLHGQAMQQLDDVQSTLEAALADMTQQTDSQLSAAAAKQALLRRPVQDWVVTIQTREGRGGAATTATQKDERVVDRVAAMRAAADALRRDVARLWEEWQAAQQEADAVLHSMVGPATKDTSVDDDDDDAIMAKAEKDLDAAAAEAMREMKENEKTFKKLIYAEECKIAQTMLSRQSKYD